MKEEVFQAALAGLLHDIGKVEQRAQDDPWRPPEGYPLEGQPVHAKWTEYFIAHHVHAPYRPAALQGVYHHQPEKSPAADRRLSTLVALADKLSAGERADEVKEDKSARPAQQMVSIFDRIGAHRQNTSLEHHYLPLGKMTLAENALFPGGKLDAAATRAAYESLRDRIRETAMTALDDPQSYLENLLAGLQRCTWAVPSAYYHSLPDVSLYDHARMTAAIAACLCDFPDERIEELLAAVRKTFSSAGREAEPEILSEPVALLVGGDISGIQNFIYTLSSKGAAKTLRGRSFYLQLLTEAVLRFVLRTAGLPATNVIYSGGGHFYFLAPLSAADKLEEAMREITRILLKHHGAGLYLALGWVSVPASGFKLGRFPFHWEHMHARLARIKQQRYQELGSELHSLLFTPAAHGGNQEKTCSVCGEEKDDTIQIAAQGEETYPICGLCQSFDTMLGRRLPEAETIILTLGQPAPRPPGSALDILAEFGVGVEMYDRQQKALEGGQALPGAERALVWALGDPAKWPPSGGLPAARVVRYTVNQVPRMTFDELQKRSHGIPRLGVLRMDVDNLGSLFKSGFGEGDASIATVARLSALSLQMSLFFEGWVKHICETVSADIYAVYSGGDDLFLIAPWDIVPGLATRIAADFARYSAHNPDVNISGGMAFIHGKYPVYQAAEDAHDALEQAKGAAGKRSFSFLGQVWTWPEFEQVKANFVRLVEIEQQMGGAHSLLQLLQRLARMEAEKARVKNRPVWGPWMWLGDYQFKRMIDDAAKKNPDLKAALEQIHGAVSPLYQNLRPWGTAARWTQLSLRKEKND